MTKEELDNWKMYYPHGWEAIVFLVDLMHKYYRDHDDVACAYLDYAIGCMRRCEEIRQYVRPN